MRHFRLKSAATREEVERLTSEYLAAGNTIRRYDARRREIGAHEREARANKRTRIASRK
jgi:hypothetical protein